MRSISANQKGSGNTCTVRIFRALMVMLVGAGGQSYRAPGLTKLHAHLFARDKGRGAFDRSLERKYQTIQGRWRPFARRVRFRDRHRESFCSIWEAVIPGLLRLSLHAPDA
jgi:hypothetical protein